MRFLQVTMTAMCVALGAMAPNLAPAAEPQERPETIAAPQWRIGSTWDYSDGYAIRVSGANQDTTIFERLDSPGQWFSMRGFLRQDAASATAKRQTIYRNVPPAVGELAVEGDVARRSLLRARDADVDGVTSHQPTFRFASSASTRARRSMSTSEVMAGSDDTSAGSGRPPVRDCPGSRLPPPLRPAIGLFQSCGQPNDVVAVDPLL